VTTPARLTLAEYIVFLDSLPVHPSRLYFASENGDVEEVKEILMKNPNVDVNWKNEGKKGKTTLYDACESGYDAIVSILLAHPGIDVNLKDMSGYTPFYSACYCGKTSSARLLLKDSKAVDFNERDVDGFTPLWRAACWGRLDVIKWWIASGREMDFGEPRNERTDAIGVAKRRGQTETATLLERFQSNATKTRHAMRVELGWYDETAAEMFALVVFVSDGLLQINNTKTTILAARFFKMARRLPLELQMIICHSVVGLPKEIIAGKDSEVAFKSLAASLLWSSFFTSSPP